MSEYCCYRECTRLKAEASPFCLEHSWAARFIVLVDYISSQKHGRPNVVNLSKIEGFRRCVELVLLEEVGPGTFYTRCTDLCQASHLFRCETHQQNPTNDDRLKYLAHLETTESAQGCQSFLETGELCGKSTLPNSYLCSQHLLQNDLPYGFVEAKLRFLESKTAGTTTKDIAGNQANFTVKYQTVEFKVNKGLVQYHCPFFRDIEEAEVEIKQDLGSIASLEHFFKALHYPHYAVEYSMKQATELWTLASYLGCTTIMRQMVIRATDQPTLDLSCVPKLLEMASKISIKELDSFKRIIYLLARQKSSSELARFAARFYQILKERKVTELDLLLELLARLLVHGEGDVIPADVLVDVVVLLPKVATLKLALPS